MEIDSDYDEYMEPIRSIQVSVQWSREQGKYAGIYIVYHNDVFIGVVGIVWVGQYPEIEVGIAKEERGNHYSSKLVSEYVSYVFDAYKEYNQIIAYIQKENVYSIRNFLAAGFTKYGEFSYVKKRY